MLGNDIVDLALAQKQSNWRRKNYLFKIFNANERALVRNAENSDTMVWLLWSMKEAAYKIMHRQTKIRLYNPWEYHCAIEFGAGTATGLVSMGKRQFKCRSALFETHIHTVALPTSISVDNVVINYAHHVKDYVRDFNILHPRLRLDKDDYLLPIMWDLQTNRSHIASVSHHGERLAIVHYVG